jgi:integrase
MPFLRGKTHWGRIKLRDGGTKRISLDTKDKNLARTFEAMLDQLRAQREWEILDRIASHKLLVGAVYDHWRDGQEGIDRLKLSLSDVDLNQHVGGWASWAQRRAATSTVEKYTSQLRQLIPEGQPFKRSEFSRRHVSATLASLKCSGSTARRHHAAWSSFANYLVEMEVIPANPLRSIRAPTPNPPKELYLSLADCLRLVNSQPLPYRALAALREGAGVEISPALGVRRRDVDEDQHTVHVHGTKNSWRDRIVMMDDWAWPYLAVALKNKLPDALLFVEPSGEAATYAHARAEHKAALKALGLNPKYTMHDSRHSFAVRWMKEGQDPQLIANNLGHRDASMVLRIYGKYRPKPSDYRRSMLGGQA